LWHSPAARHKSLVLKLGATIKNVAFEVSFHHELVKGAADGNKTVSTKEEFLDCRQGDKVPASTMTPEVLVFDRLSMEEGATS
jgi:hypothetical protein